MKKEYVGVSGYKAIVDVEEETLFIKDSITKINCFFPHIEWMNLGDVNFQGRGILDISLNDSLTTGNFFSIVYKRSQYDSMKELYETLLPYMQRIIFDQDNQQITIYNKKNDDPKLRPLNKINSSNPRTIINYQDINSYEVICDKHTINSDMLKNTASGQYVAGGTGALIGVLSSLDNGEYIVNLQIKINVNNFEKPCVYVDYISRRTEANSRMAKDLIKMCDQDIARLEILLKKDEPDKQESSSISDSVEAIKKLKELLDMGILTQEEFDKKKKELLNL